MLTFFAPARQVDEAGIDPMHVEQHGSVEGRLGLTQRGQHFTDRQQMLLQLEMPERAEPRQVDQTRTHALDPFAGKPIGRLARAFIAEDLRVLGKHALSHRVQGIAPGPATLGAGEQGIDARLAGLLVLKQTIGHAGIGRHDEDAVVQRSVATVADQDRVEQLGGT